MCILKGICLTEKFTQLSAGGGRYAFDVAKEASKGMVRQEILSLFGVDPASINIIRRSGKVKMNRLRRGHCGYTGDRKIAIVTLKDGDKIDIID